MFIEKITTKELKEFCRKPTRNFPDIVNKNSRGKSYH